MAMSTVERELIQEAVDEFQYLLLKRQDDIRHMKPPPPPEVMEMMLTQTAMVKFYIDFLDKAKAIGFTPNP